MEFKIVCNSNGSFTATVFVDGEALHSETFNNLSEAFAWLEGAAEYTLKNDDDGED